MVLLCLSDIHGEGTGLREIVAESRADVVVLVGDITHLGGHEDADSVLAPLIESGVKLLGVAGNMDAEGARQYLEEKGLSIHGRGVILGPVGFMGLGGSNPTPFGTPFELQAEEARKLLAEGLAGISGAGFKVLVSHAPPRGTKIDRGFAGMHVGSEEVREFLLAGSVELCISGHIHEAAGEDSLGRARCVNVGPFKSGRYALIRIEGSRVETIWRKR